MEEKHAAPESIASVTIKPEYPPSEYCASEPPPAYHKGQSSAVQVARIIAVTVVVVSFVLGIFILASAYVTATASCRQLEQELELLSQVADRFDGDNDGPLMPEALRGEEPKPTKRESKEEEQPPSKQPIKEIEDNSIDNSDDEEENKVHFKLPLQLDFDELAGNLIAKNQKSKMNCIVEKKRAEEIVDHQPKTVRLPFGVNITTDPRLEKLTGERMVIICESGNTQSTEPKTEKPEPEHDDEEDDSEQDTIMIQPVMIPIPQTAFRTHMPQQMPPQEQPRFQFRPQQQVHPMEAMRPPMPPMRPPMEPFRPPMEMRPFESQQPMDVQRIIAIRQNFQPQQEQRSEEVEQPQRNPLMFIPQRVQIHVEAQQPPQPQEQADSSPNPLIQNIIRHIIAQKIAEAQKPQQEPEQPRSFPLPEEVLTQLNRLPSQNRVIVAVSEPDSSEEESDSESGESQDMTEQKPEQQPQMMIQNDNRQAYMRRLPVNIPVNMMQQQPQEQEPAQNDEHRPHFLQPRSVSVEEPKSRVARSVNNPLLPEKRLKRCACDCAC
ncbi:uncharacterized protein LOC126747661 [Anthonomus grandis grandis]|uniref:uncharacterized protein LOC126747661 n=1 Tax=Anthonomus grandis grandis TaxID=2921223 RepID=UPI002166647D|nr:uncharacterized protein LOC126747661 [Anthonomus grandis grandis]